MIVYRRLNFLNKDLEVWIEGEIDKETGVVVSLPEGKRLIERYRSEVKLSTVENFVKRLLHGMRSFLEEKEADWLKIKVRIWEAQDAYVEDELVNPKLF